MTHHTAEVLVTFTRDTFAFGISLDDMKQVYIPASISNAVEANEKHKMVISENHNDVKGNTPWFAHAIIDEIDIEPETEVFDLEIPVDTRSATQRIEDDCVDYLEGIDWVAPTCEVAEAVNESTKIIGRILDTAYERGRIYCISISHANSKRASRKFWASDYKTAINHLDGENELG